MARLETQTPQLKPSALQRLRHWLWENPFLTAGAIYLFVNFVIRLVSKPASSEWDQVFVPAARRLIGGGDVYARPNLFQTLQPFTYPPFHAIIAIPFVALNAVASQVGWYLVQAATLIVLWRASWKISGGGALNRGRWTIREAIICLLGLCVGMRCVQDAIGHQQSDILIDALLVLGCLAWQHRRDFAAASAWGLAAAFKGPPLMMSAYLAWRGRWLAALWTIILALGLNVLPDAIHRPPSGLWLTQWYSRVVKPATGGIGSWYVGVTVNQSIAGAAHRFFTTGWSISHDRLSVTDRHSPLSDPTQKLLVYGVEAALLIAAAGAMGRPFRQPRNTTTAGLECAMAFILILLLSPMSHRTHFAILLLPGFFVARMVADRHNSLALWCLLASLILNGLLDHFFGFRGIADMLAWYGNVMWGAVALGLACAYALAKGPQFGSS